MKTSWRLGWVSLSMLALAACGGEDNPFGSGMTAANASSSSTPDSSNAVTPPATTNVAPTFSNSPPTTATAGNLYDFTLSATNPNNTKLAFTAQGLPSWLTLDGDSGRLSGTPTNDDAGQTADIIISVSNDTNKASLPAFHITVTAVTAPTPPPAPNNQPPTISGKPATTVVATQTYTFSPTATDPDSAVLTWSITNKPAWASFSSTTGRLSGTPSRTQTGTYANIVISVSDGSLSAKLPAFTITVSPAPNTAPVISGKPTTTVQAGTAYSFQPSASDADGDTLTFSISGKPLWATFAPNTGALTGTPAVTAAGTYSNIVISVTDGQATTSLPAFTITVTAPANQAPTISGTPATTVQVGSAYSFKPTGSDADGDTLSYSISNKPSWATFSLTTGQLSGTPTATDTGPYSNIVISVSDGKASTSLAAFTITVTGGTAIASPTGSATLHWSAPTQNTDGSTVTSLAGYKIYHGTSATALTDVRSVAAGTNTYVFDQLTSGTHYFAIDALNSVGAEGALSTTVSKLIP
jgi:hypothetical protein